MGAILPLDQTDHKRLKAMKLTFIAIAIIYTGGGQFSIPSFREKARARLNAKT